METVGVFIVNQPNLATPNYLTLENTQFSLEDNKNYPALNDKAHQLHLLAWLEHELAGDDRLTCGDSWTTAEDYGLDCNIYGNEYGAEPGFVNLVFYPIDYSTEDMKTDTETVVCRMTIALSTLPLSHAFERYVATDVSNIALSVNLLYKQNGITHVYLVRRTRPDYRVDILRVLKDTQADHKGDYHTETGSYVVEVDDMVLSDYTEQGVKTFLQNDLLNRCDFHNFSSFDTAIDFIKKFANDTRVITLPLVA